MPDSIKIVNNRLNSRKISFSTNLVIDAKKLPAFVKPSNTCSKISPILLQEKKI